MEIILHLLSGSINSISAFKRASSDIIITTLSGLTASYRLYVANADNSWTQQLQQHKIESH
jgi:hypothetical protein